jgi:Chalcone isomerase-like
MTVFRLLLLFIVLAFAITAQGFAREATHIEEALNSAKLQGSGKLTWWGFHVYDAAFYRSNHLNSPEFALELRYQKSFSGGSIANRSVEEMKKIGVSDTQAQAWGRQLAAILPNVEPGQSLAAIYIPKQGTIFYSEGKTLGQIAGPEFPRAFFGIWLDPKTSAPKLREQLLGQNCPPPLFQEVCDQ